MKKESWKPGNMLYPLPVVMVSCRNKAGEDNILTVAWTGTINTNPPMLSISIRPSRHSYLMIQESGVFTVNLTTRELMRATDFCGVTSGKDLDKFQRCDLTKEEAELISCPMIAESPVNMECRVRQEMALGSHSMFLADILRIHADSRYMDERGKFCLEKADPIVYSHGSYYDLGQELGTFGCSVRKR